MADRKKKHPENVPGKYYVDENCIGCFLCAELVPDVFARVDDEDAESESFFVKHQPHGEADEAQCLIAENTCPSNSIGRDGMEN